LFDASVELDTFYNNHVRLGQSLRNDLTGYRDLNLERLTSGMQALSEKRGASYKTYADNKNQGSYAMHTLNECEHTDYDIDVAVIWNKSDLPEDAKEARERVRDALLEKCQNFSKEPTARGNAVTVWYADGYHIDFAVYRRTLGIFGDVIRTEHAGADGWAVREPLAFSDWFSNEVTSKSPPNFFEKLVGTTVCVPAGQLRRIVRFVKGFARSRSGWALPGGIVISTLVCECYVRDASRDDIALVKTLRALLTRLRTNLEVLSPIAPGGSLVQSDKRKKEVERLRDRLEEKLPSLDILEKDDCTHKQAMLAWKDIFYHGYWTNQAKLAVAKATDTAASTSVDIECWLTKYERGPVIRRYNSNGVPLPKGLGLKFGAKVPGLVGPYQVRWCIRNEGDEAREAGEENLKWDRLLSGTDPMWTSTKYKGRHKMLCQVVQDGKVVRNGEFIVRIGSGA